MIADPAAAKVIAGGTNLVDLMKYDVERPARLVDITRLPLRAIECGAEIVLVGGAVRLHEDVGALLRP